MKTLKLLTACLLLAIAINLPERSPTIKRYSTFHDYREELMDLLRQHGKEAVAAIA